MKTKRCLIDIMVITVLFFCSVVSGTCRENGSPDEVLSKALRFADLYNWTAATPLFLQEQAVFPNSEKTSNALYARIGSLRQGSTEPVPIRSQEIADELATNPLLKRNTPLRLFALVVKGDLDGEVDSAAARADWTEVMALARELNIPKWTYRALGQIGFSDYYDGDIAACQQKVAAAVIEAAKANDVGAEIFFISTTAHGLEMQHMPDQAITYAKRAIGLAAENPDTGYPILAYESLISSMIQNGQVSEADQLCKKLLNEPLLPYAKADLLALASRIAVAAHDNSGAISKLEQAIEFTKRVGENRVLADWESSLSSMYVAAGDLSKAEELARDAVRAVESRGMTAFLPERFNNLAQVLISRGKYAEADEVYDRAGLIQDTMIGKADSVLTKTALITKAGTLYSNHFALIADHFDNPSEAYNIVERARGRAIADLLISGPTTSEKGLETERQISRLRLALMTARSTDQIRSIRDRIFLAEQYRAVNRGLTILSKNFQPVDVPKVQKSLAQSEAILEYVLAEPTSYCLVITSGANHIVRLAGKQVIEMQVAKYLASINAKTPAESEAVALYKTLLKPIQEANSKSRLIVVPDGKLHLLAFDALIDERNHQYLVESKTIVYTPSASSFYLLRSTRHPQVKPVALLALGGVPYGGSGLQQTAITRGYTPGALWDLPGSLEEVSAADKALPDPGNTILTAGRATETAFKRASSGHYRVIHLAVHGFPNVDPDRASLVMLSDASHGDDGFLEASEIVQLHINADLVVLSACDTAVGPIQGEEGISSLSNAFLLAGAGTVVSTLWAVEDAPSLALIKRFYQFLRQGQSPSQSMAEAKREILCNGSH